MFFVLDNFDMANSKLLLSSRERDPKSQQNTNYGPILGIVCRSIRLLPDNVAKYENNGYDAKNAPNYFFHDDDE